MESLDECAQLALAGVSVQFRGAFVGAPLRALEAEDLTVEAVHDLAERRDGGGACDGSSFLADGVILYTPTDNSRRQNFTLGHEFGHYLVARSEAVMDWLADQPDSLRQLEAVCDRIAQKLLLPDDLITELVSGTVISATTVQDVFNRTEASRPAVAIAIAGQLRHLGAVVLIDPTDWTVTFSSVQPDPEQGWPTVFPWTGHPVPSGHPLKTLSTGQRWTGRSFWRTPWDKEERYYIDAMHDGRRVVAVFADRDLWKTESLHIEPSREFVARPTLVVTCCGETVEVRGFPCSDCGTGYCPKCRRCKCQRDSETDASCEGCFLLFKAHLLQGGRCEECR